MKQITKQILFIVFITTLVNSQSYKIIESTSTFIKVSFNFSNQYSLRDTSIEGRTLTYIAGEDYSSRKSGEPWLPSVNVNVGIPFSAKPTVKILQIEQERFPQYLIVPILDSINQDWKSLHYDEGIYSSNAYFPMQAAEVQSLFSMRYARAAAVSISPYQYNPITRELLFNKKITIQIDYNMAPTIGMISENVDDILTNDFVNNSVINPKEAKNFVSKVRELTNKASSDSFWYDPHKNYFKIYLNKKGVYRITYEYLDTAGVPVNGLALTKLELINDGKKVPINITDSDSNGVFNSGDYFQFVGYPPTATPYCTSNIYNYENIYWFSYQADSSYQYSSIDGFPTNFDNNIKYTLKSLHYEEDLLYEPLGYAPNDRRDFWYWGTAEARNGEPYGNFTHWMTDSIAWYINESQPQVTLRVNMQGITYTNCPNGNGHSVVVKFNTNPVGSIQWNGQNSVTLECNFNVGFSGAVIPLYGENKFEVVCDGNVCTSDGSDIIRVNWFEFDYWRWNLARGNNFIFNSPPNRTGKNTYYLYGWFGNNMKIYIPSRGELIANPWIKNDADLSVYFADSIGERTEYFCYSDEFFLTPDSILADQLSDLRNSTNLADYIIIAHPKFKEAAERLAAFRTNNLPGYSTGRVKVVDIYDIYDEFSYGLLDPLALNYFVKYAFGNWQSPAPNYVALFGDMSHDYRPIYVSNRPNFIPSIAVQTPEYGQAPSDNAIVCVSGNDIVPDLAIGRISCETVEEANILVDKIINYPTDNAKPWKENILLIASGLNAQDEAQFGFNDESLFLDDEYVIPNGFTSAKVFRYPNKPRHFPFQGEGPRIREEFNRGAILANYYGHGGGGQWDLVFTTDDIYQLNNAGRLPMITSVTCYTAHFDNQDIFGEIFNKVPGKGSIGFFGSSGLTWWQAGIIINKELYKEILERRNYVFGLAVMKAKQSVNPSSFIGTQISLLTLLGDPALELAFPKYPDFQVNSIDISIEPKNPLKDDTVKIYLNYRNLGVTFQEDSVTLQFFDNSVSPENLIAEIKRGSFGQSDSVTIMWIPKNAGLHSIITRINEVDTLCELDHSDNIATTNIAVFSFGKPNIVRPINGHFQSSPNVDFIFTDIGKLFNRNFSYVIVIDTVQTLNSNFKITSPILNESDGIVHWKSPSLAGGEYFWQATIFDQSDTNKSFLNSFSIESTIGSGYSSKKSQLKNYQFENMFFDESLGSLVLNTDTLPPHPNNKKLLDTINITLPGDTYGISTLTTDGTYLYFGHIPYFRGGQKTKIYKIGTGNNLTVRGFNYGAIQNLEVNIKHQLFYHQDGFLYAPTGDDSSLLKINPITGDTDRIFLNARLLPALDGRIDSIGYYLTSDGNFVYNISAGFGSLRNKYTMRILDPSNSWNQLGNDITFAGSSAPGFSGFFVADGFLYTYESSNSGYMRRFKLSDGSFEEEWLTGVTFQSYYSWTYDWLNNFIYASVYRVGAASYKPGFHKFVGKYQDALGNATSEEIGPSVKWKSSVYNVDATGSTGTYNVLLLGKNKNTSSWDTLSYSVPPNYSLESISTLTYDYLKYHFEFVDSSYNPSAPFKLKSLLVNYDADPEIVLTPKDLTFSADTLLQGFPIDMELKIRNLGYATAENLNVKFYLNDADSAYASEYLNIPSDSTKVIKKTLPTSSLIFDNKFKVVATSPVPEFYTFNNITENSFFVSRDSIKPYFSITLDGKEIVDGDIVSAKPEILIALKDNSPLPLDTSLFTIIFDNVPLSFTRPDLEYSYTPYPNSEFKIQWNPTLKDGKHILEVLAKDASGNFFDSSISRTVFYVYNDPDLLYIYNYPNPFRNDTYFTFELRGTVVPDEFSIKIYTVAGRLIKQITVPPSAMNIGFNRIYWDGRDEDGDAIGNGVYFYKILSKLNNETKVITQKLAKVQ